MRVLKVRRLLVALCLTGLLAGGSAHAVLDDSPTPGQSAGTAVQPVAPPTPRDPAGGAGAPEQLTAPTPGAAGDDVTREGRSSDRPGNDAAPDESGAPTEGRSPAKPSVRENGQDDVQLPVCEPEPGVFLVANYNIKSGRAFGRANLPQIAAMLRDWDADVVLLQEVDRNRHVTGGVDQAAWLAAQAGYEHVFGANVLHGGTSAYGTAILSRHPILDWSNVHLPNLPGREQRGLLRAVVDLSGQPVSFYTTHFQHLSHNAPLRTTQAHAVVARLRQDPNPIVIGGDFNSAPGVAAMDVMRTVVADTWPAVESGPGHTVPSDAPRGRIDFILYSKVTPLGAIVPRTVASDHLPILAAYAYTYPDPDPCR